MFLRISTVLLGLVVCWVIAARALPKPEPWVADARDLAARCEEAVADTRPQVPHRVDLELEPGVAFGNDESHALGRVLGVAWDGVRLHVLDGMRGVAVYDTLGHRLSGYAGIGEGPGEMWDQSGSHGSRGGYNQIAVLDGGYVIVYGRDRLHLFDSGGAYIHRVLRGAELDGLFAVRHVAPIDGSRAAVARTGAMASSRADSLLRTERQLIEVAVATDQGLTMRPLAYAYDRYSGDRPLGRYPARGPYDSWTRRLWDANEGILTVVPLTAAGVCYFRVDDLALASAVRLGVRPIPVDRRERRRVIDELRERSQRVPTGGSWEDYFGFWPSHLPVNLDIVTATGSATWVERAASPDQRVVDLYHPERGYLGTTELPFDGLPLGFDDRCAYVVTMEPQGRTAADEPFYGLQRWCPANQINGLERVEQ